MAKPAAKDKAEATKNNISVAVRIRPFNAREIADPTGTAPALDFFGNTVIAKGAANLESEYTVKEKSFGFDAIFSSVDKEAADCATQESMFEAIGVPILENALDAYNGCLLAYGQTGSGKSHSVMGDIESETERGLLPRACERLFEMLERRRCDVEAAGKSMQTTLLASYLEIYQDKMFDLLVDTRTDLQVRIHPVHGPHVPNLTETPVTNIQSVIELLDFGAKNRAIGATAMNASSSRSHAIFTIDLRLHVSGSETKDMQSKIRFVDLAGSEKQKKTGATGERLLEGNAINKSLSVLARVIQALAASDTKGMKVPPFRESNLTLLLKDALMGNSRTVLLACVSPALSNIEETVGTLEFASRCKLIKTNAKKNEQDKRGLMDNLSAEKKQIEAQLEMEIQQRRVLQEGLDREMEESRRNQQLAQKMSEEKLALERQLHELEAQATQHNAAEQQNSAALLRKAEQELQESHHAFRAHQHQYESLQQDNDAKARELMRLQQEQEIRVKEQQQAVEEVQRLRQEKQLQVAQAETAYRDALSQLESARRQQEQERFEWEKRQAEREIRAKQLEVQLQSSAADQEERERLHAEREQVMQNLQLEREAREKTVLETGRLCEEFEQELVKLEVAHKQVQKQLTDLQDQQAAEQKQWEHLMLAKQSQAEELEWLREQEVVAREQDSQKHADRERANRERHAEEVQRLKNEKANELSVVETERKRAVAELQEKLLALQQKEETERRLAEESQQHVAELHEHIAEEVKAREQRELDLKHELQGLQSLSDSWALERQDLENRAQQYKARRSRLLRDLGIVGIDPGSDEESQLLPRLVNLHPDPMLEGCLIFYLPVGDTRIGANQQHCRVCLTGLGVADEACVIDNTSNEHLAIRPVDGALVRVNGAVLPEAGQALASGDRLAIGRAHIFRVVIPRCPRHAEIDRDEQEFNRAMHELQMGAEVDPRWRRGVDAAVLVVKRDFGTREANELLDKAKWASEVVAEANDIIRLAPAEFVNVTHYELAVLFEADGPPNVCVVARCDGGRTVVSTPGPDMVGRGNSVGIWEVSRFVEERLDDMHDAADELIKWPTGRAEARSMDDRIQWEARAWAEVPLHEYRILAEQCGKLRDRRSKHEEALGDGGGLLSWFHWKRNPGGEPVHGGQSGQSDSVGGRFWDLLGRAAGFSPVLTPGCTAPDMVRPSPSSAPQRTQSKKSKLAPPSSCDAVGFLRHPLRSNSQPARVVAGPPPNATHSKAAGPPPKVMVRPNPNRGDLWPAERLVDSVRRKVVVCKSSSPDSVANRGTVTWESSQGRCSASPAYREQEPAEVQVTELFDGKLGVRIRMEGLIITGFDVPEAAALGWQEGDEIVAMNGNPVRNKEDFKRELTEARKELPIVFTVLRISKESVTCIKETE